jgi:hypothetical protein
MTASGRFDPFLEPSANDLSLRISSVAENACLSCVRAAIRHRLPLRLRGCLKVASLVTGPGFVQAAG